MDDPEPVAEDMPPTQLDRIEAIAERVETKLDDALAAQTPTNPAKDGDDGE